MRPNKSLQRVAALPWENIKSIQTLLSPSISAVLHGGVSSKELSALLRRNPSWSSSERQLAAEAIFGVALWRRRLAHLLDDDWQDPTQAPDKYLRALIGGDPTQEIKDLATFYSLPDWIAEIFTREFGDEAASLADALNLPGPVFVRVNQIKQTLAGLQQNLREEGIESEACQYATGGLRLKTTQPNIYGSKSYQRGEFEVQDEGSQLLALLLEVTPGEEIVDYCAGAGGKTLAFASQMNNTGKIFAFDVDEERLSRLQRRASNAGASCISVCRAEQDLPMVGAIFVDAPCSELGALRRGPDMRFRVKESVDWPEDQYNILQHASRWVKPGGRLVYATCTLRHGENQAVVERFLGENRNFQRRALPVYSTFYREGFFTSLPHRHGTDGFFAAMLTRKEVV